MQHNENNLYLTIYKITGLNIGGRMVAWLQCKVGEVQS